MNNYSKFIEDASKILLEYTDMNTNDIENFLNFYVKLLYVDINDAVKRDNLLLVYNMFELLKLQYEKESGYGNSWEKRGDIGVFFNIARKWDRLENYILNNGQIKGDESFKDTIMDIAIYMMLWLTKILREGNEEGSK